MPEKQSTVTVFYVRLYKDPESCFGPSASFSASSIVIFS